MDRVSGNPHLRSEMWGTRIVGDGRKSGGEEHQEREVDGEGVVLLVGGEGEEGEDEGGEDEEEEDGLVAEGEWRCARLMSRRLRQAVMRAAGAKRLQGKSQTRWRDQ